METLYEFVLPDRFHMVSDFAEMILIGDSMYMKVGDDWMKTPVGTGMELTQFAEVAVEESDILEAQLEGTEDVEGVPCQKYVYTVTGEEQTFEATAWIGVEDGLPRKILTQMEGTTVTQTLYDFNADITIEPPPGVE
jgi:hypothetical protein